MEILCPLRLTPVSSSASLMSHTNAVFQLESLVLFVVGCLVSKPGKASVLCLADVGACMHRQVLRQKCGYRCSPSCSGPDHVHVVVMSVYDSCRNLWHLCTCRYLSPSFLCLHATCYTSVDLEFKNSAVDCMNLSMVFHDVKGPVSVL